MRKMKYPDAEKTIQDFYMSVSNCNNQAEFYSSAATVYPSVSEE